MSRSKPLEMKLTRIVIAVLVVFLFLSVGGYYFRDILFSLLGFHNTSVTQDVLNEAEKQLPGYGYLVTPDDMKLVWVKEETAALFGYAPEDIVGKKNYDMIEPRLDRTKIIAEILTHVSNRGGRFVTIVNGKNGQDYVTEITNKTFIYKNEGYIAGRIHNTKKISEREAIEKYPINLNP